MDREKKIDKLEFSILLISNFEIVKLIIHHNSLAGGDLVHEFRGATSQYILSELERRKSELKPQLVWIGAQKEPGITSRTWKWVNGMNIYKNTYICIYIYLAPVPLPSQSFRFVNQVWFSDHSEIVGKYLISF